MTDSIQKIPVFGVGFNPAPLTLEGCSGWAENEDEALKIVQGLRETTELVTMMSHQFGVDYRLAGVKRERIVIKDDEDNTTAHCLGGIATRKSFGPF